MDVLLVENSAEKDGVLAMDANNNCNVLGVLCGAPARGISLALLFDQGVACNALNILEILIILN